MQVTITAGCHFIPFRMDIIKRTDDSWQGCGENGTFIHWQQNVERCRHFRRQSDSNSTLRCVLLTHFSCAQLFVTLWTIATRLLCPWDSPGQNTGVGCRALPEGFIPYSQILPKVNENIEHTSTKSLYINVHNSIIHNNHKMQITQMPIKWHK